MTAPDMVEIVAKVIADNSVIIHDGRDYGDMTASTLTPDKMARAVLQALTEAGTVEWGVVVDGLTYMFGSHEFDRAKSFTRTHDGTLSQRTKAGPWTVIES